MKDALEGRTSVHLNDAIPSPRQIVRLPMRIDVSHQNKDRVTNFEIPPADHLTKKFILSRSAPTRISNQNQSVMG